MYLTHPHPEALEGESVCKVDKGEEDEEKKKLKGKKLKLPDSMLGRRRDGVPNSDAPDAAWAGKAKKIQAIVKKGAQWLAQRGVTFNNCDFYSLHGWKSGCRGHWQKCCAGSAGEVALECQPCIGLIERVRLVSPAALQDQAAPGDPGEEQASLEEAAARLVSPAALQDQATPEDPGEEQAALEEAAARLVSPAALQDQAALGDPGEEQAALEEAAAKNSLDLFQPAALQEQAALEDPRKDEADLEKAALKISLPHGGDGAVPNGNGSPASPPESISANQVGGGQIVLPYTGRKASYTLVDWGPDIGSFDAWMVATGRDKLYTRVESDTQKDGFIFQCTSCMEYGGGNRPRDKQVKLPRLTRCCATIMKKHETVSITHQEALAQAALVPAAPRAEVCRGYRFNLKWALMEQAGFPRVSWIVSGPVAWLAFICVHSVCPPLFTWFAWVHVCSSPFTLLARCYDVLFRFYFLCLYFSALAHNVTCSS